jgi:soluble lytic murein transglycosylase
MRKINTHASLRRHVLAVLMTATACAAILAVLQPWRGDGAQKRQIVEQPASAFSISETERQPGRVATVRTALAENETARDTNLSNDPAVPNPPEAIQLAKRSPSPASVPIPEKQDGDAVPLPAKNETASRDETTDTEDTPEQAAAEPKPRGRLGKAEGDAALAPLLSYKAPAGDIAAIKDFVKQVYRGNYSEARRLMRKLSDPVARKFAHWYYYRNKAPDTDASEIIAFLDENPRWPSREALQESAEDALFWRETDNQQIIDYFVGKQPVSGAGLAALGSAYIAKGRADDGRALIARAWREHPLTPAIEKRIRKLKLLTPADHRARADYLLMQDNKSYVGAAARLLPLIDKKWRTSVKARMASVKRARNAGTLLSRLAKDVKQDPAVLLARIQWLRRANNDKKVWSLLRSAPKTAEKLIDPEEWWKVREAHVRLALNAGKPKTAYAIAKDHGGGLEHWDLSDAEFLAGWIALRFLDKPEAARNHFLAAAAAGGLPKRRARAAYWLGRTELVLDNQRQAVARFAEAAQHYHTFYGQLAHQMIASSGAKIAFRTFVRPTEPEIKSFAAQDVMKAIVLTQQADLENLMAVFLYDLARDIESAPEMILLCELASRVAPPHRAVRMAKIAVNRDFAVEHYAYPDALPEFKALGDGQEIENALIHALTRQESEFNPGIVSSAGAVGLMQLLPSTAKMMARAHNLKFSKKKLSADPAYNVSLGTAFLHRLIGNYDGSYMMALAGYNAGPGRVRQWVRLFGDPRAKEVDPIDWIERIPFNETRNYVHKILESAQIYRFRLLGDNAPLRLAEDLHRGRKDKPIFLIGVAGN